MQEANKATHTSPSGKPSRRQVRKLLRLLPPSFDRRQPPGPTDREPGQPDSQAVSRRSREKYKSQNSCAYYCPDSITEASQAPTPVDSRLTRPSRRQVPKLMRLLLPRFDLRLPRGPEAQRPDGQVPSTQGPTTSQSRSRPPLRPTPDGGPGPRSTDTQRPSRGAGQGEHRHSRHSTNITKDAQSRALRAR